MKPLPYRIITPDRGHLPRGWRFSFYPAYTIPKGKPQMPEHPEKVDKAFHDAGLTVKMRSWEPAQD